jgi:hypothetical protein
MSLVNQQMLLRKIMSKSIVKGGVGPINPNLSREGVFSPTGNQRVELPGNTIMNDVAFFGQPNPFGDRATVRYTNKMNLDKQNAFPLPSYYNEIIVNDANTPLVGPQQLVHPELQTVQSMMVERQIVQTSPRLATTQFFPELTQNTNSFL